MQSIFIKYSRGHPKRYQDLIDQRNYEEGPWGSIEKSLIQIDKLLDERDEEESQDILKATKLKIESMKRT